MRLTKKRVLWIGGALLLLFIINRSCSRPAKTATGSLLYAEVEKGTLTVSVRASGEILSRDANRIIPKIKRSTVVSFLAPEGSRVTKGEIMAQFATDEIDRQISEGETTLADRELKLASAQADLDIQLLDNANDLKAAQQAQEDAQLELKKFQEGDDLKDRRAAQLKIDTSISKRERSIRKHAEAQELLKDGFITEDQVEEERIAMETAIVDAETAQLELEMLNAYDLPLRQNKVESALDKAKTELEKTLKKNQVQEQNKRQSLDAAVRARDRAADDLDKLRKERVDYDLRAPIDGVVNYGDPDNAWRRGDVQAGMSLNPGEVLITIPDMSAMQANVNVPESDIDKVKVGQPAKIYVEAMGRRSFDGSVKRVAEVANASGWMSSDVKEFKVEVTIPNGDGLRPGFTCDVEITVETLDDVLVLPIQAVFRDGDQWVVYKGSSSHQTKVPVTIGSSSTTHVQIKDGLKEGERVLLNLSGE